MWRKWKQKLKSSTHRAYNFNDEVRNDLIEVAMCNWWTRVTLKQLCFMLYYLEQILTQKHLEAIEGSQAKCKDFLMNKTIFF